MGIQLEWYDDAHSIIHWRFENDWTIDDLQVALDKNCEMMLTVQARVDLILDISASGLMPPGLIRFIRYYRATPHPLSQLKIVVGTHDYLRLFWQNIAPLAPASWRVEFACSLDEARSMIEQDRAQVPVLS